MPEQLPIPQPGSLPAAPAASTEVLLARASDYLLAEKADATRRAYASDWRHFSDWCWAQGADGVSPMPAAIPTVAAYLAYMADIGLKASTITRRTAAIRYAHRLQGLEPPTNAEPIKALLRGIRRRIGVSVERKAPATARAIALMLKRIDADPIIGVRDRAMLLLGFSAALRRSELVALKHNDLEQVPEGLVVHIRRSKTDQEGAGHQVAVPRGSKLRPVEAVEAWLAAAHITDGYVFRPIAKGGRIGAGPLTGESVAQIVKARAKAAKLDPALFSGHSLRAGFVTSALEACADLFRVMDVTRHRSVDTLRAYDRRAKQFKDHAGKGFL